VRAASARILVEAHTVQAAVAVTRAKCGTLRRCIIRKSRVTRARPDEYEVRL